MKKTALSLLFLIIMVSFSYGQGFDQIGVAPPYGDMFSGQAQLMIDLKSESGRSGAAGTDVDQDGKYEYWHTTYSPGGMVYCFEETGNDTLELIWLSDSSTASNGSTPRDVKISDLDNDGKQEIIFQVGGSLLDSNNIAIPEKGIHIYEWDGVTDNGFGEAPAFTINLGTSFNDSLSLAIIENFNIGDIDSDGKQELLLPLNGSSSAIKGTKDAATTPFSEDRFVIMSINGNIGDAFGTTAQIEFQISPRDVDQDGETDNILGGGSPYDMIMADTDGDGMMEAACVSYNNLAIFFIEATGPDAYTTGAETFFKLTEGVETQGQGDDFTLGISVADMDNDGKDEVYVPGYFANRVFVVKDMNGDATNLDGATETASILDGGFGVTAVPGFGVVVGGAAEPNNDITRYEFTGTNVMDPTHWVGDTTALADQMSGWAFKVTDAFDSDNDGNLEFGLPYQAVIDLIDANNDGTPDGIDPVNNRVFRIVEWNENKVGIKDITYIMPGDYKLAQNYPNPFNPTTSISYSLPIQNNISVNVYNFLGEHVVTLVNNKSQQAGVHEIVWNSMDKNGSRVASGTYFYELKYGNFSQTKRMTLLK